MVRATVHRGGGRAKLKNPMHHMVPPQRGTKVRGRGRWRLGRLGTGGEQKQAKGGLAQPLRRGEQAVAADLDEAAGKNVLQEHRDEIAMKSKAGSVRVFHCSDREGW